MSSSQTGGASSKGIGPIQGIAMTVTTFVGTGLMVLPALSVSIAEAQTAYSWIITTLIVIPIAIIFALLGARLPHAGGASHYIGQAFSSKLQNAIGWLFLSILLIGPAVAVKIAANYLAVFLGISDSETAPLAFYGIYFFIFALFLGFGLAGIQTSAKTQTLIVVLMLSAIAWLGYQGDVVNTVDLVVMPIDSAQWMSTLSAISVVFWCFLGIEVMAHMGAEFRNPNRDFPIAMIGGISLVILCYLVIVLLIFSYGGYGDETTNNQSIAILVANIAGEQSSRWVALGAFIIAFANVSIYLLGFSRMFQAMANNKALPAMFGKLNRKGNPSNAVIAVNLICALSLILGEVFNLKMESLIEMTNGAFLTIYTLASCSAWYLLRGKLRYLAVLSVIACVFIAVQIGESMLFALFVLACAYFFLDFKKAETKKEADKLNTAG